MQIFLIHCARVSELQKRGGADVADYASLCDVVLYSGHLHTTLRLVPTCLLVSDRLYCLFADVSGLKFSDNYIVSVIETPASDSDSGVVDNVPAPVTGVLETAVCVNNNGSQVSDPSDLRYSILQGNRTLFSINEITGEFSVANVPFDYERNSSYSVCIHCYLASEPSINASGIVTININPVNEYLPSLGPKVLNFPETSPVGTVVASTDKSQGPLFVYSASDKDEGSDGVVIYVFKESTSDIRFFDLERATGTLTLNQEIDVDQISDGYKELIIDIIACNDDIEVESCPDTDFTIFVTAVNDIDPEFNQSSYSANVSESEVNGTVVLQATCLDGDQGMVGEVTSIGFQDGTSNVILSTFDLAVDFKDSPSLVYVSLRSELDYENTTSYSFTLACSDGERVATTLVTVNVLPVNDIPPRFEQAEFDGQAHYEFSVERADLTPKDTIIGRVAATDADSGDVGATLTYSIPDSSSKFKIDPETGDLTLKDYLYLGDGETFDFDVVASDGEHEIRASVRVTAIGLLSVVEWLFVAIICSVLLAIICTVGLIVLRHFIKVCNTKVHKNVK